MILKNITVLSLEQATTLPFLTYHLACDGARVIRVENPQRPDPNRFVGRKVLDEEGMNSYFLPNNCGKEAITLNLGSAKGQVILHQLIARLKVDVFACNQRPRSYTRLGIDYDTLRAVKPDLIWVGISGFGPDSDEAAYDPILQARAGFMDLTGDPDGPPLVFGLPMVDLGAGEHGYGQIMKALYHRAVTGEGMRLDISMFRSAVSWMVSPVMLTHSLNETAARRGNIHQFFAPASVYPTRDGYVYMAVGNDRQWAAISELPAFAALARPEYARNTGRIADVSALNRQLTETFKGLTTAAAIELFQGIGVPVSRVNTMVDVVADPLVVAHLIHLSDPRSGLMVALPGPPVGETPSLRFPPRLGEHNRQVYIEEMGYAAETFAAWQEQGII
ncbi:MAG: CoA transferase [Anaerolineae bacterium]|nr:CoA transferase [Anaerolineae bacterium]